MMIKMMYNAKLNEEINKENKLNCGDEKPKKYVLDAKSGIYFSKLLR
jgi:hypothetical protein